MSKKLYKVTCRGMTHGSGSGYKFGIAYVVADNPQQAYEFIRNDLDARNFGSNADRELEKVELLAENKPFPDCKIRLYLRDESKLP